MSGASIFQSIFADAWHSMPPALHQHYANRPYTRDAVTVEGVMEVRVSRLMQLFSPLLKWSGLLVPYQGHEVPTTVTFRSETDSHAFVFDREFRFPSKAPCHFRSRMVPAGGNEVIEYMSLGIGWRAAYRFANNKVTLTHRGYVWRVLGYNIPMPLHWLFGKGYAEEEATGEASFRMKMAILHPWFGEVYAYAGNFEVKEVILATPETTPTFSEGQLFKSQVGERWKNLSPHIQKRFDANPSPDKPIRYQGTMTRVEASFTGVVLANLVRFSGALLPHVGRDVATDILVFSKHGMPDIFKQRVYYFAGKKPFTFNSNMRLAENGDVLEFVGFGLGMKLVVAEKDGNLHFSDNGYFFSIGKAHIPLPSPFNPGKTRLVHSDMGEKTFKIVIDIQHPIFGKMYYQEGVFNHVEEAV